MTTLRYFIEAVWKGKGATTQAKEDVDKLGESVKKTDEKSRGYIKTAGELTGKVSTMAAAFAPAGAVIKKAFDLAKEGKQIEATQKRFEALTQSIGTNAGVLEDLRQITRNQVNDFEAMASANQLMVMGLAGSHEQLKKHFDVVTRLKKPNEEFGDALENWSLLLANQSLPRLDSFGISSGRVRKRINELTTGVNALDRETAFVQATLEEAEKAIIKTGQAGDISGSAFDRLTTKIENTTNAVKLQMSEGLEPWAKLLVGDYTAAIETAIGSSNNLLTSQAELQAAAQRTTKAWMESLNFIGLVSGAQGQVGGELKTLIATYGDFTGSNEDLVRSLEALTGAQVEVSRGYVQIEGKTFASVEALRDLNTELGEAGKAQTNYAGRLEDSAEISEKSERASRQRATAIQIAAKAEEDARQATIQYSQALAEQRGVSEELRDKQRQVAQQSGIVNGISAETRTMVRQANEALREAKEAEEERAAAIEVAAEKMAIAEEAQRQYNARLGDYFTQAMQAGSETSFFNESMDKLGVGYARVQTLTDKQATDLARLEGIYNTAQEQVNLYQQAMDESGASTGSLSAKLEAQQAIADRAQGQIAALREESTRLVETYTTATFNQDNVNKAILQGIDAAGGGAIAMAAYGLATGQYSEAQAEAAIKHALLQAEIDKLTEKYAQGELSLNDLIQGSKDFISELNDMSISVNETTGSVALFDRSLTDTTTNADALEKKIGSVESVTTPLNQSMRTAAGGVDALKGSVIPAVEQTTNLRDVLSGLNGQTTQSRHTHTTQYREEGSPPNVGELDSPDVGGGVPGLSKGGRISDVLPGRGTPGRDSVLALLDPREIVIPPTHSHSLESAMRFLQGTTRPLNITPLPPMPAGIGTNNIGGDTVHVTVQSNEQAAIVAAMLSNNRRMKRRGKAFA